MEQKVEVSIIIVNYNTRELLHDCIQSIQSITRDVVYEIIVVDNASSDDSIEMLRVQFPSVVVIESEENLGFGKANNLGVERAKGNYLFFLNSDTLLVNDAISILFRFISRHETIGVCGACLYNKDLVPNLSVVVSPTQWDEFASLLPSALQKRQDIACFHDREYPLEVDCITGADMMVRKSVFVRSGKFDPDFFMYAEEVELTHRVKKNGYKVFLVPEAKIIHLEGMSAKTEAINERVAAEKLFSKFLYYRKVFGGSTARNVYFCHKLKCVLACSLFAVTRKSGKLFYWRQKELLLDRGYKKYKSRYS